LPTEAHQHRGRSRLRRTRPHEQGGRRPV